MVIFLWHGYYRIHIIFKSWIFSFICTLFYMSLVVMYSFKFPWQELVKRIAKLSQNFEEASMSTRRHEIFLSNTEKDFASSAEVQQVRNTFIDFYSNNFPCVPNIKTNFLSGCFFPKNCQFVEPTPTLELPWPLQP